jgi:hypothetical protein
MNFDIEAGVIDDKRTLKKESSSNSTNSNRDELIDNGIEIEGPFM